MSALIVRGDARQLPLTDASVDLICTSPPYWALRDYRDGDESLAGQIGAETTPAEYIANLLACTAEWARVLKPGGSIFVNLGDKYAADGAYKSLLLLPERYRIAAVYDLGLIARAVIIWEKPDAMPESVTDRVRRSHEDWVHLTKGPDYFSALDEIRTPYQASTLSRNRYARKAHTPASYTDVTRGVLRDERRAGHEANPGGKLPGSVWSIAAQPLRVPKELATEHNAAFPVEWPRRLILGWSPVAGLVVDPFGGTGTTALVASTLGRRGISVDRSAGYCRIAAWRTTDPGERARALGLPKPEPVNEGQEPLFMEAS